VTRPDECFYYLISRTTLVATALLRQEFGAAGVDSVRPSYLGVLLALWTEDGLQVAELGRRAGLEPSSMTGVLDRMERDGLIRREPDPDDRRAHRIFLTEVGRKSERPVRRVVDRMLERLTEGVSASRLESTKATLRRVLELAHKHR